MRAAGLALVAIALASCGVRPDASPHRLPDVTVTASPGSIARPAAVRVYLVAGGSVVAVRRLVLAPASVESRLASLLRGPDETETTAGLRTALSIPARGASARDGVAVVDLAALFGDVPRAEHVVAVAQVVLTLTEDPRVTAVRFTVGGRGRAVPLPGGTPADRAVTRSDYAALERP